MHVHDMFLHELFLIGESEAQKHALCLALSQHIIGARLKVYTAN